MGHTPSSSLISCGIVIDISELQMSLDAHRSSNLLAPPRNSLLKVLLKVEESRSVHESSARRASWRRDGDRCREVHLYTPTLMAVCSTVNCFHMYRPPLYMGG